MTPQLLREYLDAMRGAGLMRGTLDIPWTMNEDGTLATLRLAVEFEPAPPPAGDVITPGGWKGPEHLDAAFKPEEQLP